MEISKVIIAKSNESAPVAMVMTGPDLDDMSMVMSTDIPNERRGWVNSLTPMLMGKKFVVLPTIISDVSEAERKHHEIWRLHGAQFSAEKYCEDLYTNLFDDINETYDLNTKINEMMGGEPNITEIVDIHPWTILNKLDQSKASSVIALAEAEGFARIIFNFEHRVSKTYKDTWGWAIYDPSNGVVCVTYCPEQFLTLIAGNKCLHAGYLRLYDCVTQQGLQCEGQSRVLDAMMQTLTDMESMNEEEMSRFDRAFKL